MMRPLHAILALLFSFGLLLPSAECSPCGAGGCGGAPTKQTCCCCQGESACDTNDPTGASDREIASDRHHDALAAATLAASNPNHVVRSCCCCPSGERPLAVAERSDTINKRTVRELPSHAGALIGVGESSHADAVLVTAAQSQPPPLPAWTRRAVLCIYTI
ncbi:MAG: hypothetical protein K8R92_01740 [Planctomycetes bacterium]|nr:hypothetical protein [Planctomycetota bacterium]